MGRSVLKSVVIYAVISTTVTALLFMLVLIPAYVHMASSHVPGAYDALYLSKYSPYHTIVLEVDYQPGMKPDPVAIETLRQQIETYSGKRVLMYVNPDIGPDEVPPFINGDELFHTASMLQQAHRNYRTGWLWGNITMYVLYLNTTWNPGNSEYSSNMPGPHKTRTDVYSVGVTYAADSMIIFKGSLVNDGIECTILLHELGHIWGLNHTDRSPSIMNAQFDVIAGQNANETDYPRDFSNEEKARLSSLHRSPHILPIF